MIQHVGSNLELGTIYAFITTPNMFLGTTSAIVIHNGCSATDFALLCFAYGRPKHPNLYPSGFHLVVKKIGFLVSSHLICTSYFSLFKCRYQYIYKHDETKNVIMRQSR